MKFESKHILLFVFVFAVVLTTVLSFRSKIVLKLMLNKEINGLIIGTDYVDHSYHADAILFLNYKPLERKLNVISIPRDTYIRHYSDLKIDRLASVYAFYHKKNKDHNVASKAFTRVMESIFENKIPIDFFIRFSYEGFKEVIKVVGKIKVAIDEPMRYVDKAGGLDIKFSPGIHYLDADDALKYIRYRGEIGDLERLSRQKKFLKSLISNISNPTMILRINRFFKVVGKHVHTDLTKFELFNLLLEFRHIDAEKVQHFILPGKIRGPYWDFDFKKFIAFLSKLEMEINKEDHRRISVIVCNATDVKGAAYEIRNKLIEHGFNVIDYTNYITQQNKTIILAYHGNLSAAKKISKIIGFGEVHSEYDEDNISDVVVIIGQDYKKFASTKF